MDEHQDQKSRQDIVRDEAAPIPAARRQLIVE